MANFCDSYAIPTISRFGGSIGRPVINDAIENPLSVNHSTLNINKRAP